MSVSSHQFPGQGQADAQLQGYGFVVQAIDTQCFCLFDKLGGRFRSRPTPTIPATSIGWIPTFDMTPSLSANYAADLHLADMEFISQDPLAFSIFVSSQDFYDLLRGQLDSVMILSLASGSSSSAKIHIPIVVLSCANIQMTLSDTDTWWIVAFVAGEFFSEIFPGEYQGESVGSYISHAPHGEQAISPWSTASLPEPACFGLFDTRPETLYISVTVSRDQSGFQKNPPMRSILQGYLLAVNYYGGWR